MDVLATAGIHLDIACGANKNTGFVGIDVRALPGVDIVHDLNEYPWPLPDACVKMAVCSHYVEHINPSNFGFVRFMDECWRVLQVDGQLAIVAPYAGSFGFWQDPTHINGCNEATWAYFAPEHPSGLYRIYEPKPWRIETLNWSPEANIEVLLRKMEIKKYDQLS
jgi:SAM-dependent methyltransferase